MPATSAGMTSQHSQRLVSGRAFMEKVVDLASGLSADARHLREIGNCCPLDRLERPKVMEQRALACRPDARDFLQAGFAYVALATLAMGADGETVRFVAQSLNKVEHRIPRLELEMFPSGNEKSLEAGIALGTFGNREQGNIRYAEGGERFLRSA